MTIYIIQVLFITQIHIPVKNHSKTRPKLGQKHPKSKKRLKSLINQWFTSEKKTSKWLTNWPIDCIL
jgi:hypothetical protein